MAFLSDVFCCFTRSTPAPPEMTESHPARPIPLRRDDQTQSHTPNGVSYNSNNDHEGYTPTIPLPRYTPRPMSIREKTLEAHMPDPPVSSSSSRSQSYTPTGDEKHPCEYEREYRDRDRDGVTADDGSSAFSFPSSYGNTSTATRETPPPPYSAGVSPAPTPSTRRSTVSSNYSYTYSQQQQPMVHIVQPRPVFQRPDWMVRSPRCSIDEEVERSRRFSWESR